MPTIAIVPSRYIVTGTYEFDISLMKNGSAWDLTTATITLFLVHPTKGALQKVFTVVNAALGLIKYVSAKNVDLDVPGDYGIYCIVEDAANGIYDPTPTFNFIVYKN